MSDSVRPHRRQPTRPHHPLDSPGKNTGMGCHFLLQCIKVKSESAVSQSYPTLSDPMDCSLPGSSVHGIFQARVLEWGATAFSVYTLPCVKELDSRKLPDSTGSSDQCHEGWVGDSGREAQERGGTCICCMQIADSPLLYNRN